MAWKKRLLQLFRIVVSVILVVWLFQMADSAHLAARLAQMSLFFTILMMLVSNVDRILMAYKWNLLLRAKGIHLSWFDAFSTYYKSSFLGMLILPTVGADAMRIFETSRKVGHTEDIISSVVIERFLGIVALGVVGVLSLFLFVGQLDQGGWNNLVQLLLLIVGVTVVFLVSLNPRWQKGITERLLNARWKPLRKGGQILQSYQQYARHRKALFIFLLLSIVEQFIPAITAYLVAKALYLDIPFLYFLIFIPIILTIVRLPISFDGFGVREGLYVYFFGLVGVIASDAFLIGLLSSVLWRIGTAPPALYFFWASGKTPAVPAPTEPPVEAGSRSSA